ncbi:hypothetical protein [Natronococcus sp. A-GB7]|uniref:DUF7096 domain-containing protein n=1 Tax=Natronococcus sp. A-GB7 TaxID=3037649 RepID=UPI00241FD6FA|nr:hypothetical protein [Natronococcus sp. A-GB7]MDG5820825.1 hypothetical protein [Natronococcus sp. A-GB7]
MKSAMAVVLAGLLVLSVPAMAVSAADGEPNETDGIVFETDEPDQGATFVEANGTTNRLDPGEEQRSERVEYGSGLGTSLMAADDELRVDYEQETLVRSGFDNASDEEREERVQAGYDRLQERIDGLEERERTAVRAHAADEQSTAQLLQTFSRNYHESATIERALDDLVTYANEIPGYSLSTRDDARKLEMHRSDTRSQLETTTSQSGDDRKPLAVRTTETGYTLSLLDRNYVRETTRFDSRNTTQSNQFDDITDAHGTAQELYPWVFGADHESHSSDAVESRTGQLYRIQAIHDQGHLTTYLDGGTGTAYREVQTLDYRQLPTINSSQWHDDGLVLSINETAANGPAEVVVTDAETGEPEPASVSADGEDVGETDSDGSLWLLPPDGEYDLRAETDDGSIEGTVSSSDAPSDDE